ncbi:MAG: RNA polymerase sigma factor [Bifidobacteriaceae bacterium]|jgi:RNA polymerase sigma-70 factor (ECF subfamily)|nr:RNA polymerase sigma factor [Bifidobacteriaceae bacterium]
MEGDPIRGVALAQAQAAPQPAARGGQATAPRSHAEGFSVVYRLQYPRILAFARRRLGDRATAEDCAAEVFRIAWERVAAGEPVPTPGWLFGAARKVLANRYRADARARDAKRRLGDQLEFQAHLTGGAEPGGGTDSVVDRVVAALEHLPSGQRELLTARYWDHLTGAELAVLADCSVGAVWVRLHRARAAFRESYSTKEES